MGRIDLAGARRSAYYPLVGTRPPTDEFWERWRDARRRLLLLDYDGTLAPFRATRARARPAPGIVPALRRTLAAGAAEVAIVSGRPAGDVPPLLGGLDVEVVGGHGWEVRRPGGRLERRPLHPAQTAALAEAERRVAEAGLSRRLERKYASLAVHTRGLAPDRALRIEVAARRIFAAIERRGEADIEGRGFDGGIELRARGADKGSAVRALLERLGPGGYAVYLGDDQTDEDAFEAIEASGRGAGILVRADERATRASFRIAGPREVAGFIERVASNGGPPRSSTPARVAAARRPAARPGRLIVVSNRLPSKDSVGGLVSALVPTLESAPPGSLWFGWSGRSGVAAGRAGAVERGRDGGVPTLGIDLADRDVDGHYNGFCNRALWPLLHCFPGRVVAEAADYACFRRVNALFARALRRRLRPNDRVWIHDYHLFPLGRELRRRGFEGPLGFFLHVPFPPGEIFEALPWARDILESMLAYDLVGFHTESYARNYARALGDELGATPGEDGRIRADGRTQRIGTYPIGIDPEATRRAADEKSARRRGLKSRHGVRHRKIILGVDRLDYTKGIAERLKAFARLLEIAPRFRKRVSFLQISAPSRTRVPEYVRQRREIEELVGHLNGRFGAEDWVPIRYLFRAYSQRDLAAFYREADVCLVSPLRDGMNLVAKEYVAAQTGDPGVLVLSRFAGAAAELRDALIVNPYDIEGTARALARALDMPLEERARRQAALLAPVMEHTAARWAEGFLRDLGRATPAHESK